MQRRNRAEKNFICREIKRWHQDPGSQLAFKQLSSLRKTKVTASYAFSHYNSSWGVLGFHLAVRLAPVNTFEDILFHLGGFVIKRPLEI